MSRTSHWSLDPLEVDRTVDGELSLPERASREAEMHADPALAARVVARREFLARLADSLARDEAVARESVDLTGLEQRVRSALRSGVASRSRLRVVWARRRTAILGVAAAAVIVLGLGLGFFGPSPAEAKPPQLLAAEVLRAASAGTHPIGSCETGQDTSPFRFPLVADRELGVKACAEDRRSTKAVLYRIEDLAVVGFVAVRDEGAKEGAEIGVTRLDDVVVFDVPIRGTTYYLAVNREAVDRHGVCAACHGPVNATGKNPHVLKERRLPTR